MFPGHKTPRFRIIPAESNRVWALNLLLEIRVGA